MDLTLVFTGLYGKIKRSCVRGHFRLSELPRKGVRGEEAGAPPPHGKSQEKPQCVFDILLGRWDVFHTIHPIHMIRKHRNLFRVWISYAF